MLTLSAQHIELLTAFRRELHQNPCLSLEEQPTIDRIVAFLAEHASGECVRIVDGHGLVCHFRSGQSGPHVVVRADVDALPIRETSGVGYASENQGVSHSCGHDGHSAILCGLAIALTQDPIQKGSVTLLFQPAEEIGRGSAMVLNDPYFVGLNIDQIVALHNIPGEPAGKVIVKEGVQCAASTGVVLKLLGETAHAATPESGKSPIQASMEILHYLKELPDLFKGSGFGLRVTVAGISSGGPNFGVSPGQSTIWATLRTLDTELLAKASHELKLKTQELATKHGLGHEFELTEHFDATFNDPELVKNFIEISSQWGSKIEIMNGPFLWSEDFGKFTSKFRGFLFGLGAGEQCHPLHHSAYNFPDEIIPTGIKLFEKYIRDQLK